MRKVRFLKSIFALQSERAVVCFKKAFCFVLTPETILKSVLRYKHVHIFKTDVIFYFLFKTNMTKSNKALKKLRSLQSLKCVNSNKTILLLGDKPQEFFFYLIYAMNCI